MTVLVTGLAAASLPSSWQKIDKPRILVIVTIHQPEHLPWLGFFHKMSEVDCFIVLDTVQYRRRYFQNRNRIRTSDGEQWLTVPVRCASRNETRICDVLIASEPRGWMRKNLECLRHNYATAPHFDRYWGGFSEVYGCQHESLCAYNLELIRYLMGVFGIKRRLVMASDLGGGGTKGDLVLNLCRAAGATRYHSGISGREYLNAAAFEEAGIEVTFQQFHHPVYRQRHNPFIPCLCAVDLLFNCGPESLGVIHGQGVPVMEELFL